MSFRFNYQRGEIATTLTLIAVVVMAAGAIIGANITRNQDVRSLAQNSCGLSTPPSIIAVTSSSVTCQYIATAPSEGYVCALIDENEPAGNQVTAGQNDPWGGSWNGNIAGVPLPFKPGKSLNSSHMYTLVVYHYASPDSCKQTQSYSGANLTSFTPGGNPQPTTPPQNPTSIPPTRAPTAQCQFPSSQLCGENCSGSCRGSGSCWECPAFVVTPTPTTPPQCQFPSSSLCGENCTSSCRGNGTCWECPNFVPTQTPTRTPTRTPTPRPLTGRAECEVQYRGSCMSATACNQLANSTVLSLPRGCTAPSGSCCVISTPTYTPTPRPNNNNLTPVSVAITTDRQGCSNTTYASGYVRSVCADGTYIIPYVVSQNDQNQARIL